jgi:hypothetical protein
MLLCSSFAKAQGKHRVENSGWKGSFGSRGLAAGHRTRVGKLLHVWRLPFGIIGNFHSGIFPESNHRTIGGKVSMPFSIAKDVNCQVRESSTSVCGSIRPGLSRQTHGLGAGPGKDNSPLTGQQ